MSLAPAIALENFQAELTQQLDAIARWWTVHSQDASQGGFYGQISQDNIPNPLADKGAILTARILWFFSSLCLVSDNAEYRDMADRAFNALQDNFTDTECGGLFWTISSKHAISNSKKQTYAQAFGIYGYVAYYKLSKNTAALDAAKQLFSSIETHCYDANHKGYLESFSRHWGLLDDVRLSEFDDNAPFTMNTHLHVLEAYTALYSVHPDPAVEAALRNLIEIHSGKILQKESQHLGLFFDLNWADKSDAVSHGHDIEASWLLWEAATTLNDLDVLKALRPHVIDLALVCHDVAYAPYGYVINETEISGATDPTSIWWVQAEALIGFLNAYGVTADLKYFEATLHIWDNIKAQHIDAKGGEWLWGGSAGPAATVRSYKAGIWKAPYHNGRAMLEGLSRVKSLSGLAQLPATPRIFKVSEKT